VDYHRRISEETKATKGPRYRSKPTLVVLLWRHPGPIEPNRAQRIVSRFVFFFRLFFTHYRTQRWKRRRRQDAPWTPVGDALPAASRRHVNRYGNDASDCRPQGPFASRKSGGGRQVEGEGGDKLGTSKCAGASCRLHSRDARSATTDRHHRDRADRSEPVQSR